MTFRSLVAALLVGAIAFASPPARAPGQTPQPTLHLEIAVDPHTLDPLLATNGTESDVAGLMLDSLIDFDATNHPVPALASVVPSRGNGGISADGRTITLHLRHDVTWHDGAAFTAADVLFTIHAILDPAHNVGNRESYANIASVDAPDPFTVRFTLKQRQGFFLSQVAGGYPILPAHLLAKSANLNSDPFGAAPVGTGPYRFLKWLRGDRIEFVANPAYYRGAPRIARVDVIVVPDANTEGVLLRQHAIDYAAVESSQFAQLRNVDDLAHTIAPANDVNTIAMNTERPIMRDRAVRLAIARAFERKRIVQTISFGTGIPAYGDLPLFMYDGHPSAGWADGDAAGARALLDADGWKTGPDGVRVKNGVPLRLQFISYTGSTSGSALDLEVMQSLRDAGVDVNYKTSSPGLYFGPAGSGAPLLSGAFDLATVSYSGGKEPANAYMFGCASRSPRGFNVARYCNPRMDRLEAAAQAEYDPQRRDRLVQQIEDLAVADAPYAFMYHTPLRIVYNPALVPVPPALNAAWYGIERWRFASDPP